MTEGVVIPGWKIPDNCRTCPFFHVFAAFDRFDDFDKIECVINHRELPKNRLRELMLVRDDNCELRKCMIKDVVRTGDGLYDTYEPPDKEIAKHVTEVFRKSTERMEAEVSV